MSRVRFLVACVALCVSGILASPGRGQETRLGDVVESGQSLIVGDAGPGSYELAGPESASSLFQMRVGARSTGMGTLAVRNGARLDLARDLEVGRNGSGVARVENGATLSVGNRLLVGIARLDRPVAPDASGTVVVSGPGSLLSVGNEIYVGLPEPGLLRVEAGARVEVLADQFFGLHVGQDFTVGPELRAPAGPGTVHITGSGSAIVGRIRLGALGRAVVDGRATLSSGMFVSEGGEVLVSGPGTEVADLTVFGGTALVERGARAPNLTVGFGATATVTGAGTVVRDPAVGGSRSLLLVEDGARVRLTHLDFFIQGPDSLLVASGPTTRFEANPLVTSYNLPPRAEFRVRDATLALDVLCPVVTHYGVLDVIGIIDGDLSCSAIMLVGRGEIGLLEVTGGFVKNRARLELEVAGPGPVEHDLVHAAGAVSIVGRVAVVFLDGFVPAPGQRFTMITSDTGVEYAPTTFWTTGLPAGLGVVPRVSETEVAFEVTALP